MKNQALFFWKDESKKLKCRLLQFLFGALRVNSSTIQLLIVTVETKRLSRLKMPPWKPYM